MKIIQLILEIFGWLFIVFGTTAATALIGFLIYINWETGSGKMLSLLIIFIGFIIGVVWATRIWKKHGTIEWLSGIIRITLDWNYLITHSLTSNSIANYKTIYNPNQ